MSSMNFFFFLLNEGFNIIFFHITKHKKYNSIRSNTFKAIKIYIYISSYVIHIYTLILYIINE